MVALDAFSQALTNPLLSENVFNETTFSLEGMKIIEKTRSLREIVARNVQQPHDFLVSFDQAKDNTGTN
jgi:prostaglandin-endoperoxide synthase 2